MLSGRAFKIGIVVTLALVLCAFIALGGSAFYYLTQAHTAAAVEMNAAPVPAPRVGALAPDFTLNDVNNKPVQLASLRGNIVIVNFWATWCGPCRAELGALEKTRAQYAERKVIILGINQEEYVDSVRGYADLYHLNFTMLLDLRAEVGRAYKVNGLPTTYFVDRQGLIQHIEIGGPMTEAFLQSQLGKLLGEGQ